MNPAQGQLPGQGQGAQSPSQQQAGGQQAPSVTQGQGQNQNATQNQGQNPNLNHSGYYQPAQIRALNILSEEEKNKYVAGLEGLWAKIKSSPGGSNEYKQASEKIWNFSKMLQNKINARQAQIRAHQQSMQQQQAQQAQQAQQQAQQNQQQPQQQQQQQPLQQMPQQTQQQRPQSQNQQPRQQATPQQQQGQQAQQPQPRPQSAAQKPQAQNQGQQQAAQNGAAPNQNQASGQPQQASNQASKLPENIMSHLRQLKIKGLPDFDNKPAAEQQKHINDLRTRYGRALMSVDLAKTRIRAIEGTMQKRNQEGKPFTEEEMKKINEQKAQQQKIHHDASKWIEGFRRQHVISDNSSNAQSGANQNAQAGNAGAAAPTGQQAGAAAANRASPANQSAAAQQAQAQLQAQQRPQLANNAGAQNQQAGAGQAGRGQAPNAQAPQTTNTGGPGRALSHEAAMSLANQRAANTANNAQAQQQAGGQPQAAGTPTSGGGAPAANSQQTAQHAQQQAQQPQQPPSQQQTPVQQQQPPPQQGHPHAHPTQAQTQMHSKMPIPKVLPDKAVGVPQPVQTGGGVKGSRPTMNQGTGTMGASMHQPAIQKIPAYNNEAEGDHVLSKKKLDELVRQVCGGSSDGQEGNLLSPDVEENVLNMADSFVDNVLHAASRNAKERGSKMLEIRDIQLVLERTYNIRVPGYSSDELRTVRKVQPTTGWIAKMSAVQAAKVMPGKGE